MKLFDLHSNCDVQNGYSYATVTTGTTTGEIIDTALFHGLEFIVTAGTLVDGTFTVSVLESDDAAMAGATAVSAEETLGDATMLVTDDDAVKRVGTVGKKRYQQLQIVAAGATTGGPISASAMRFSPFHSPTAD